MSFAPAKASAEGSRLGIGTATNSQVDSSTHTTGGNSTADDHRTTSQLKDVSVKSGDNNIQFGTDALPIVEKLLSAKDEVYQLQSEKKQNEEINTRRDQLYGLVGLNVHDNVDAANDMINSMMTFYTMMIKKREDALARLYNLFNDETTKLKETNRELQGQLVELQEQLRDLEGQPNQNDQNNALLQALSIKTPEELALEAEKQDWIDKSAKISIEIKAKQELLEPLETAQKKNPDDSFIRASMKPIEDYLTEISKTHQSYLDKVSELESKLKELQDKKLSTLCIKCGDSLSRVPSGTSSNPSTADSYSGRSIFSTNSRHPSDFSLESIEEESVSGQKERSTSLPLLKPG